MSPWTRGVTAQLAGKPINVSYDGAAISYEGWVIPKGSKNYDNAMKFIAFATQPKPAGGAREVHLVRTEQQQGAPADRCECREAAAI